MLEHTLRQTMVLNDNNVLVFFTEPLALPFTLLTIFFVWRLGKEEPLNMPGTTAERGARNRTATDFRSEALAGFYREAAKGSGPKRARLHRAMLKMIDHGFWNPGDRLPTDLELTERLPLSLATVQAALQLLADQEIVVRKKRNGTFVASEEHLSRMLIFFRFVDPDSVRPLVVEERERAVAETGERGPWSDFLGIRDRYVQWSRTLEIGGEFMVRSEFYFLQPEASGTSRSSRGIAQGHRDSTVAAGPVRTADHRPQLAVRIQDV